MSENNEKMTIPCSACQAGQMHRRYLTYLTWLGDELITVPDFPAWVCDVCGRREYDLHALNQLTLLLTPNTGKTPPRKRRAVRSPTDKKGARPTTND